MSADEPDVRADDPALEAEAGAEGEMLRRAAFFDAADATTEYVSVDVGDARLLVRTEDKHIGRTLFVKQGRGDVKVLARCVMTAQALLGPKTIAGRTFVDVGANIGSTTVAAMVNHPFARAVAIEPEPDNFTTLRLNLVLNGLDDRVTALRAAVSNATGELDLVVSPARSGRHWVASDPAALTSVKAGESVVKVPTVTLDSLVDDGMLSLRSVGLLWVDAENHEGQILEGASQLVGAGVPAVFEWDTEGLDRRGNVEKIQEVVGEHYTHFADMRRSVEAAAAFTLHPAEKLESYEHPSDARGTRHFTEIMCFRLAPEQVRGAGRRIRAQRDRIARGDGAQPAPAPAERAPAKARDREQERIERDLAAIARRLERKSQRRTQQPS